MEIKNPSSGGSGAVSSVSNSDGTLTVTPTTGAVVASLNLGHVNTWTGNQTVQGATTTMPSWFAQLAGDAFARVRVGLNGTDTPSIAFGSGAAARDTNIQRDGVATFRFGAADAAAPLAQTFNVQNVLAGTANVAGANFTINGSQGTGTGAGGNILFQCAAAGTTGSTQNPLINSATITPIGITCLGINFIAGTTAPTNGWYLNSSALSVVTASTIRFSFSNTGNFSSANINGIMIMPGTPSATTPLFIPRRSDTTTGIGSQASGNMSFIAGGAEIERVRANGVIGVLQTTVAALPSAATAGAGARRFVTDATAPVFAATITGGGAVFCPVYSDGTNWRAG